MPYQPVPRTSPELQSSGPCRQAGSLDRRPLGSIAVPISVLHRVGYILTLNKLSCFIHGGPSLPVGSRHGGTYRAYIL
jgi:hypothetical protein